MGGIALAWLFGEGILVWRWRKAGAPPTPGALLLSSGVFASLAVLGQAQSARTFAAALAWGYDLAILLQVLGQGKVAVSTGWPPPLITNPNAILPSGHDHGPASQFGPPISGLSGTAAGLAQGIVAGASGGASLNPGSTVGGAAAGGGFAATGGAG